MFPDVFYIRRRLFLPWKGEQQRHQAVHHRTSIAGAMGLTGSDFYHETNAAQAASYLKRYIKSINRQLQTIAEANNDME